jgi:hypothetical protein
VYVIATKFRQGGFTTTLLAWGLYRCLYHQEDWIVLSGQNRESFYCADLIENILSYMPIVPKYGRVGNTISFYNTNRNKIIFAKDSRSMGGNVIINEAAFHRDMDVKWKTTIPTIKDKCIVISTTNGIGNWFHDTYVNALEKKNQFHVFKTEYTEHPDYNNEEYVVKMKENLGEKGWLQEMNQSFVIESPQEWGIHDSFLYYAGKKVGRVSDDFVKMVMKWWSKKP